jgi:hypothetical protein
MTDQQWHLTPEIMTVLSGHFDQQVRDLMPEEWTVPVHLEPPPEEPEPGVYLINGQLIQRRAADEEKHRWLINGHVGMWIWSAVIDRYWCHGATMQQLVPEVDA